QSVSAGKRIGAVGVSGQRSAEQPHLHFGVREAGQRQAYRDPLEFLAPPPAPPRPEPAPPRGAPVPVGDRAPIPLPAPLVATAPAPAPAATHAAPPRALGSSLPATRSSRVPAHGLHAPQPAESRRQSAARASAPVAHPARAAAHAPASPHPSRPKPAARRAPSHAPEVRLDGAPRDAAGSQAAAPRRSTSTASSGRGGIDVGWLAACIGLVAAACALGRGGGAKAAALRGRDVFAALLKPLDGRR
ncbi:MAG: hypothetical protein ACJ77M_12785, partial [Thermoleophilaceae bacterium]